eukprot:c21650_g1_i1 orf=355-618(+)
MPYKRGGSKEFSPTQVSLLQRHDQLAKRNSTIDVRTKSLSMAPTSFTFIICVGLYRNSHLGNMETRTSDNRSMQKCISNNMRKRPSF